MSGVPQIQFGVPSGSRPQGPLQFQPQRRYFGEEKKTEMKKSSIFFSNPGETAVDKTQKPQFLKEGGGKLEFKKKTNVIAPQNTQPSFPSPENTASSQSNIPSAATSSKPLMYSSLIIKPSTDYLSGGLQLMGRNVGPSHEVSGRFGQNTMEALPKSGFGETKKPTNDQGYLPFSFSTQTKYDTKPTTENSGKLNYTPNFTSDYPNSYSGTSYNPPSAISYNTPSWSQPISGNSYYTLASQTSDYKTFDALSKDYLADTKKGYTQPSSYGAPKDDKFYLDMASKKYESPSLYTSTASTSTTSYAPVYEQKTESIFTKKNNTYDQSSSSSNSYSRPAGNIPNIVELSCKAKKSDFNIGKKLGKGQFGDVFIVKHKQTGFICAMKVIKKSTIKEEKVQEQLLRELKIQFYLHHKNIVALYGFFQDSDSVYLLLELCCQGQLFDIVKKERRLAEDRTADIIKEVCLGIEAIHREKIIHRDIKPQNIIMHDGVPKICDFGWAVYRGDGLRTTFCGTPMYTSPQMLRGEKYDEKIDIWAIGILTYQLLIGRIPFRIMCEDDLQRILTDSITFPDYVDVSSTAKDFILKVLRRDQSEQYDIEDILNHRFLTNRQKKQTFTEEFRKLME